MAAIERVYRLGFNHLLGRLEIGAHALAAILAAKAGFLIATKTDGRVEIIGAIDPNHSGFDLRRDVKRQIDILAPDRGGEAIFGVLVSYTASSGVRKLMATSTSQKISSATRVFAGETLVTSAGLRK